MSGELITRIERVTVFRDRALIERTGALSDGILQREGSDVVVSVGGLPLLLDDSTFRVRIEDERLTLRDVRIEPVDLRDKTKSEERGELETLRKKIGHLRETIDNRRRIIVELQQWLRIALPGPPIVDGREQEKPSFPVEAGRDYVDYLVGMLTARQEEVRKLTGELVILEREYQTKSEIAEYNAKDWSDDPAARWCKRALVRLAVDPAQKIENVTLSASYCIEGARWAPTYSLHYRDGAQKATLVYAVAVAQGTGEDWRGALLGFSAADLKREVQLADLPSRRIGRAQPPKAPSLKPAPQPAAEVFASFENWLERAEEPDFEQVEELQGELQDRAEKLIENGEKIIVLQEKLEESVITDNSPIAGRGLPNKKGAMGKPQAPPPPMPPPAAAPMPRPQPSVTQFSAADIPLPEAEMASGLMLESEEEMEGDFDDALVDSFAKVARKEKRKASPERMRTGSADMEYDEKAREPEPMEMIGESAIDGSVPAINYRAFRMAGPQEYQRGRLVPAPASADNNGAIEAFGDARSKAAAIESPGPQLSSSYFQVYRSGGPADVPSDGGVHTVEIDSAEGAAELDYRCAPIVDQQVFRRMRFTNPFSFVLPPGRSAVYLDGGFAFNTSIAVSSKGVALIPLGVEQRLKVSRNARFSERESGIISSEAELTQKIEIEVASSLDRAVEVEIIDRVPEPGENEKDIKVEDLDGKPKSEKIESYEGRLLAGGRKFSLPVEPGKTAKLDFGYRISIPAKKEIAGGNRRE